MFYRPRMRRPADFFHWLGVRRTFTLAFLVALVLGGLTARDTNSAVGQKAQAGSCFSRVAQWGIQGGTGGPNVAKASLGATVCLGDNGAIASVSPFLSGGVEGVGTPFGYVWTPGSAHVITQNSHRAIFGATATLKECAPLGKLSPCSLTDTETFTGYVELMPGPYPPGVIGNGFTATKHWCSLTGCISETSAGFVRIS